LLKTEQELDLPRRLQIEFTRVIQQITDTTGKEVSGAEIWEQFQTHYLTVAKPYELVSFSTTQNAAGADRAQVSAKLRKDGDDIELDGEGGGSVEAFAQAISAGMNVEIRVLDYHEHAIGAGTDAKAVCYMEMQVDGRELWGVGVHGDIVTASLRAIVSGVNRRIEMGE
ncbi:MAG: alpha-isopropylmalate synthase regulatory domain-containing protein, partial [Acidimicrobiales bacterium]